MASAAVGPTSPISPTSRVPRLAAVVRGTSPRKSVISRLTQFNATKPVTVVPFAPERLSITQTNMTPEMLKALAENGTGGRRGTKTKKEDSVTTLFAALRMRRVLHRVQTGHELPGPRIIVDETEANLERHLKVLSRYKIRQKEPETDEAQQLRNLPRFMVNPHSTIYKMWQLVTLSVIIYQSIMVPFGLAFGSSDTTVIDILMSCIFATDILVGFNTPFADDVDETEYIIDRCQIASNYLRGWFLFDLLACLPFDYVLLLINNSKRNLNVLGLLKVLRVPRLLRLVRLLRVAKIFKLRPELRRWLQYSRHANLFRLVRLVASFLVATHYIACFWYGIVMSDETRAQDPSTDTKHLYIVAFYSSLLIVMGQNIAVSTDSEYFFCVIIMVVGAVIMAVVFGNVAILIANYYESQSSYQKKMEWLFASMNRMKLPYELQNRINAYYLAMWERHGTLDGAVTAFIPELSRNLAYEVELFLRMDMINRAPIFQNCSTKVVQELVMELELQVFMPGDYVVVRGEVGNDMYFVQNGLCEVTKEIEVQPPPAVSRQPSMSFSALSFGQKKSSDSHDGQKAQEAQPGQQGHPPSKSPRTSKVTVPPPKHKEIVLKVLGQGDYFGEIALLMNCKRTANVRAQVFSELCTLTRDVFESISTRYLEDRTIIEKFIMDKYDPRMLQAALKQSQEVSMRGSPSVTATAAAKLKTSTPQSSLSNTTISCGEGASKGEFDAAQITGLLTQVLHRIDHLEQQLGKESEERRESESKMRMSLNEAAIRFASSSPSNSTGATTPRHPGALNRLRVKTLADEPERVSQRNLFAGELTQAAAAEGYLKSNTSDEVLTDNTSRDKSMEKSIASAEVVAFDSPNDPNAVKPQLSVTGARSWRNMRRDSLSITMRLRTNANSKKGQQGYTPGIGVGVGAVGVGAVAATGSSRRLGSSNSRRSSARTSGRESDVVSSDPSMFSPEPEPRIRGVDDENGDRFPSDLLDDLASSLDPKTQS